MDDRETGSLLEMEGRVCKWDGRGGKKDEQKSLLRGESFLSATERAGGGDMTQQLAIECHRGNVCTPSIDAHGWQPEDGWNGWLLVHYKGLARFTGSSMGTMANVRDITLVGKHAVSERRTGHTGTPEYGVQEISVHYYGLGYGVVIGKLMTRVQIIRSLHRVLESKSPLVYSYHRARYYYYKCSLKQWLEA